MSACRDCVYYGQSVVVTDYCSRLTGPNNKLTPINPDGPTCQFFASRSKLTRCESCGNYMVDGVLYQSEKGTKYICKLCASQSGTCDLCNERIHCEFETNPSPTPKVVTKQVQTNIGITVTQVTNPARIEETCKKGCVCWDKEYDACMRKEFATCGKYTPLD